jgi:hypothetical protein
LEKQGIQLIVDSACRECKQFSFKRIEEYLEEWLDKDDPLEANRDLRLGRPPVYSVHSAAQLASCLAGPPQIDWARLFVGTDP